jgi:hypothetical protein
MRRHPEVLCMSRVRIMCIPRYCILAECVMCRFSKFKFINIYIEIPKSPPFGYVWCSLCTLNQPLSPSPEWNSCYWKNTCWSAQQWVTQILVVVSPNSSPGPTLFQGTVHVKSQSIKKHLKCPSRYEASIWRHITMSWLQFCQLSSSQ